MQHYIENTVVQVLKLRNMRLDNILATNDKRRGLDRWFLSKIKNQAIRFDDLWKSSKYDHPPECFRLYCRNYRYIFLLHGFVSRYSKIIVLKCLDMQC